MSHDAVSEKLDASADGLTSAEATQRREEYGLNRLPRAKPRTWWKIGLDQFQNPLIYILAIAATVSVAIGEVTDGVFIVAVLLLNAIIGGAQEWQAERSSQALQQLLRTRATVFRDGETREIDSEDVVPGDVVLLESGYRVPADVRRVRTSAKNVVEITETARDYMRTLASEDDPTVAPTPLPPAIESEIERRRELFPYAEFRLEGQVPDVTVTANEMLGTVFRNLLNNAVQHNGSADPVVTVSCAATDGYVVVRIADNGSGIPDGQKDAVFRKGRKGADSFGSGIGLYLVRQLVEQYGGAVDIEDNEPEGSVFRVRLPTAD
ncbi:sensor histidine kinase [Halarchaeum nitratireducens]|uniref:Histidine kinase domain-containing protein n=1 Tax=Halarchaeum nitratireducens TaxID=489913 RepID=A0A830GEI6_9EURY|nr:HAMP domain-containing sensor histidine kinase [Halarchaeum nitratireducens]GGN24728.1 hypothetical protein GCM10009021_28220 [Halarchaeum nitratireducens]